MTDKIPAKTSSPLALGFRRALGITVSEDMNPQLNDVFKIIKTQLNNVNEVEHSDRGMDHPGLWATPISPNTIGMWHIFDDNHDISKIWEEMKKRYYDPATETSYSDELTDLGYSITQYVYREAIDFPFFIRSNEDGTFTIGGKEYAEQSVKTPEEAIKAVGKFVANTFSTAYNTDHLTENLATLNREVAEKDSNFTEGMRSVIQQEAPIIGQLFLDLWEQQGTFSAIKKYNDLNYWPKPLILNDNKSMVLYAYNDDWKDDTTSFEGVIRNWFACPEGFFSKIPPEDFAVSITLNEDDSLTMKANGYKDTTYQTSDEVLHAIGNVIGNVVMQYERKQGYKSKFQP